MNEYFYGDRINSTYKAKETDPDTNSPVGNLNPFANNVTADAAHIDDVPSVETIPDLAPAIETIVPETPWNEKIPDLAPAVETFTHEAPVATAAGASAALLNREESGHFRTRWSEIQGMFVDEPRGAVQQADALVTEVIEQITRMFTSEHSTLEGQWKQGSEVSTEDLRKALQHYRSFFNRLVV